MRNKDSAGEYSSQQGASPSVSVGDVDAVTNEASTHRRVPVVACVKDKVPGVCKLMLRQATVARKTRNCCLTERSIIAVLQGLLLPHLIIQDRRGKVKYRSRRASPSQTTGEPGLTDHVRRRRVVMILGDEKGRARDLKSPGPCSSPGSAAPFSSHFCVGAKRM